MESDSEILGLSHRWFDCFCWFILQVGAGGEKSLLLLVVLVYFWGRDGVILFLEECKAVGDSS